MKTKVWIRLLVALFLISGALGAYLLVPSQDAHRAEILSGGQVVHSVDLHTAATYTVTGENGGYNVITVRDGKIAVTEASCPDHYCVKRGYCASGTDIVCLPNKLVIHFLGVQTVDAAAG